MEEELSYAYEVWSWPRSFYLDEMGLAHANRRGDAMQRTHSEFFGLPMLDGVAALPVVTCELLDHVPILEDGRTSVATGIIIINK